VTPLVVAGERALRRSIRIAPLTLSVDETHLRDELDRSNVTLFVGAGLSAAVGLPLWVDLVKPLAAELGRTLPPAEYITAVQLLGIAADYEARFGRQALVSYLRRSLAITGVSPSEAHAIITTLWPRGLVITTNYDSLLEDAYYRAGKGCHVVVNDSDLAYWDATETKIVKLRGDLAQPASLVITQRDFDVAPLERPLLTQQLRLVVATTTILFIGYSLSDPDLQLVLHQIQHQLGGHGRMPYSAQFDPDQDAIERFKQLGVRVLALPTRGRSRTKALLDFLTGLSS
jgi:hypothetical protein